MAGTRVDIRDVLKGIDGLSRAADKASASFFRELIPDTKAEILSNRRGLARRAVSTRKRHGPGRVLGRVLSQYRWKADESGLEGLSWVPYSLALHDGGVVGNSASLPARPFTRLSDTFVRMVADKYASFVLRKGWK